MKKTIMSMLCLVLVAAGLYGCGTQKAAQPVQQPQEEKIQLTGLDGINYAIKTLPDNVVQYLKTKSEYKDLYTDKKFVIYFVGADCPYAQAFIDAIDPVSSNSEFSSKYNFYPQEASGSKTFDNMDDANADIEFSNTCHEFCIVNPSKNEIFAIDGVGYEEAEKVGSIIEQLKDW